MKSYVGKHIKGSGDERWLTLIDKSYRMLRPSAELPCFQILYNPDYNTFGEGFFWQGWWIQNSLGFCLGAHSLLKGEWRDVLQRSYDLFWDRMGDGHRIGRDVDCRVETGRLYDLVAPDGSLGDCVGFGQGIVYKQGDGDFDNYEWFYEATAAGILTQVEDCLFERDAEKFLAYLPRLRRSMEFIEKKRAENGLFLVGPCCNLLAPSWGAGYDEKNDKIVPAYLTGLSVTYGEALRLMCEAAKFIGDDELYTLCKNRYDITRESLRLLVTSEGYLCKSMDTDGTMHGVYGAKKYGYMESVCNADALCYGSLDNTTLEGIYNGIASISELRKFGPLCTNYPHLDDTYNSFARHTNKPDSTGWKSGDWVDGGCWGTVEGRAILGYMRMGRFEDAYRSAEYYMRWAEDWRMDAPLSQWGENFSNPWANESDGYEKTNRPIAVMVDNFATVTCLLRGLIGITAVADGFIVKPQIPDTIDELYISEPYYFGGKKVYVSYGKDDGKSVCSIGKIKLTPDENGYFKITADMLDCFGKDDTIFMIFGNAKPVDGINTIESELAYDTTLMKNASLERPNIPYPEANFRPFFDGKKKAIENMLNETASALEFFNGGIN